MDLYRPFYDSQITPDNKKYSVWVMKEGEPTLIHFGDRNMQHYYDRIGRWHKLDHLDDKRRYLYRKRAAGIRDKKNRYTYKDINSANYWSYNYLW